MQEFLALVEIVDDAGDLGKVILKNGVKKPPRI